MNLVHKLSLRFLLFFFLLKSIEVYSQQTKVSQEVGISIGAANYYGDLNDHFGYKGIGPSAGFFIRQNIGTRFAFKTCFNYMKVGYKDAYSTRPFNQNRNLSFESNIFDITGQFEFNFLNYIKNIYYEDEGSPFTPYLSMGLGVFFFNPQAEYQGKMYDLQALGTEGQLDEYYTGNSRYKLYNLALVYGGGLKYQATKNLVLGIDFSIRRTFTDYLDDVSGYYVPEISLPEADKGIAYQLYNRSKELGDYTNKTGKQRGTLDGNDDYATFQLQISWLFLSSSCKN
jgi:hypothetical protein